ncbi:metal-dependent hydrolase [Vibrio mediterranei]|uniref:metal-dependent hydrolase n=1 Tax=Vibrio mediterranei TaxID=689 RepID=UPI004068BF5A
MTGVGHLYTGFALALYPASIVQEHGWLAMCLAAGATVLGSTAPDWLEIPITIKDKDTKKRIGTRRLIKHRTWTHVLLWWIAAFWVCASLVRGDTLPYLDSFDWTHKDLLFSTLVGFTAGGVLHLLCDLPNKQSIPLFTPWDRFALNFWNSNRFEKPVALVVLGLSIWITFESHYPPLISNYLS